MHYILTLKMDMKSTTLSFLALVLLSCFQGCSDYFTYNFTSHPQHITVIPQQKLEDEVEQFFDGKGEEKNGKGKEGGDEERDAKKKAVAISQRLADTSWGSQFVQTAGHLYGWRPDYCRLFQARNNPGINLDDFIGKDEDIKKLEPAFWESYLRHVYFDVMRYTPSAQRPENKTIFESIDINIVKGQTNVKVRGEGKLDPARSVDQIRVDNSFLSSLSDIRTKVPKCSPRRLEDSRSVGIKENQSSVKSNEETAPALSKSFLSRFLRIIDNDHDQLLLDRDQLKRAKHRIEAWTKRKESNDDRDLTVSKLSPASISPSIERVKSTQPKEKLVFLDTEAGQKAVVEYMGNLVGKCSVESHSVKGENKSACEKRAIESLKYLLDELKPKDENLALENFEQRQSFDLALSSILNSPDVMNRLDYVSTYLLFFAYPYAASGSVNLEEEFWNIFKVTQVPRRLEDRSRYYEVDLERAWNGLRVQIENVETTVQYAPLEIATVTREGSQGIEIKPEPSVELKGTVKGKIETPLTITSSLKTTVVEKLLKELDRRSSWLNPERNILRLTQRGVDSINISGGLKERVTLHIPASELELPFLDFVGDEIEVKNVRQPVYKKVTALSVSIGVVREPFDFRRSASEKYGLPDSADAYYIVVVSSPVELQVWNWTRIVDRLEMKDIELSFGPTIKEPKEVPIWFFSPAHNMKAPARLATTSGDDLRVALKEGLNRLIENHQPKSLKESQGGEAKKLDVKCVKAKTQQTGTKGLYLVLGKSGQFARQKSNKIGEIWIGKQGSTSETRRDILASEKLEDQKYSFSKVDIVPFNGDETEILRRLDKKGLCS